jgi:hypothetical protein
LKAKLAVKARVKRDGKWINPAAREVAIVAASIMLFLYHASFRSRMR